jgi:hypothetical protein
MQTDPLSFMPQEVSILAATGSAFFEQLWWQQKSGDRPIGSILMIESIWFPSYRDTGGYSYGKP